ARTNTPPATNAATFQRRFTAAHSSSIVYVRSIDFSLFKASFFPGQPELNHVPIHQRCSDCRVEETRIAHRRDPELQIPRERPVEADLAAVADAAGLPGGEGVDVAVDADAEMAAQL